jgi:hypothetical protein
LPSMSLFFLRSLVIYREIATNTNLLAALIANLKLADYFPLLFICISYGTIKSTVFHLSDLAKNVHVFLGSLPERQVY